MNGKLTDDDLIDYTHNVKYSHSKYGNTSKHLETKAYTKVKCIVLSQGYHESSATNKDMIDLDTMQFVK